MKKTTYCTGQYYLPVLPLLLLFFLCSGWVYSQSSALKWISDGKYDKAYFYLLKKYKKKPTDITVNFSFARLYGSKNYSSCNFRQAHVYIKATETFYGQLNDEKEKKNLDRIPINSRVIHDELMQICLLSFEKAVSENTIEGYETFMKYMNDSAPLVKKAAVRRDELAFSTAEQVNTGTAYLEFMQKYPDAIQFAQARLRYDKALFEEVTAGGQLKDFIRFALEYPQNAYLPVAEDSIYNKMIKKKTPDELGFFVKAFPMNRHTREVYRILFDQFCWDGELVTLQNFIKNYPRFPQNEKYYIDALKLANYAWEIGLTEPVNTGLFRIMEENDTLDFTSVETLNQNEELNHRLKREKAKSGNLQFSLMWNNYNDLDLICVEPGGEELSFKNKLSSSGGELDVDMNWVYGPEATTDSLFSAFRSSDKPVENIYWSSEKAMTGIYRIYVRYSTRFTDEDSTRFTLRVKYNNKFRDFNGVLVFDPARPLKLVHELSYYRAEGELDCEINENTCRLYDDYISRAAPKELAYVAVQKLMEPDIRRKRWNHALFTAAKYREKFSSSETMYDKMNKVVRMLEEKDENTLLHHLGHAINTTGCEYSPVISADNRVLFFCGKERNDNLGKEDIYYSRRKTEMINGKPVESWSEARLFEYINTEKKNEAPMSVSFDGNTMLVFSAGDIYYSEKNKQGWSELKRFPYPINTEYWEGDAILSSDGKAILFASTRAGGYNLNTEQEHYHGDMSYPSDIYVCVKTPSGWGSLQNLGRIINTPFCERSPYLHPDMKTMFFSSDGHYGLGRLDIFRVTRLSDTCWTAWSDPVNLGKSINTAGADWGHCINTSGEYLYISSDNKDERYQEDIFRYSLPESLRPQIVATVSGAVVSSSRQPVDAEIIWEDLTENKPIGSSRCNPEDGSYFIILPAGHLYGYYASKTGYYPVSKNIDLRNLKAFREYTDTMIMISMTEIGTLKKGITLNNLFFDTDRSELRPESFPELNRLAGMLKEILKKEQDIQVEIMGHTDNVGMDEHNLDLSEKRALSVYQYLISHGITKTYLKATGYGKTMPVGTNETEEGRQRNRRVEFRFVKNGK